MSLISELKRRNVLRMAVLYVLAAWLIMQIVEVFMTLAALPVWVGQATLVLLMLGFPIALIFSWFYEITPDGLALEKDVPSHASITHTTGRRIEFIVIALLGAAVIMFAVDKWWVSAPPDQSIAVLPFANLSEDPSAEYFGDGIAEELLNELANLTTLHVAARTSSFYFKGKNEPIPSIAKQLGVRTVLEGSVRRSGDRLRITAQLIDAANGYHLWSEKFDRDVGDIFAIQEEIAKSIADALEINILGKASSKLSAIDTESFEAYDYFLLGRYHREKRNPDSLDKSIELFTRAVSLDDRFALGYAALAASHLYQAYYSGLSPERVVELTTPLLEKSLALNPRLAEAHSARASVRLLVGDFAAADSGFRKALELKPNYAGAWSSLGYSLVLQSRLKEAAQAYARSESLDPVNASLQFNIGALMMLSGRYEEGHAAIKKSMVLAPERSGLEFMLAHWSIAYGRFEEAAQWLVKGLKREPESVHAPSMMVRLFGNLGMWDQAWASIALGRENSQENISYIDEVANFYFRSGDYNEFSKFVASEYAKVDQVATNEFSPTSQKRYFWHGFAAINAGNYVQAIEDLTNAAGGPTGIENLVYDEIKPVKYMAYALQQQGLSNEADELLDKCLGLATGAMDQGWATPMILYRTAQVYALLGQSDDAIEHLRQAVDKGWPAPMGDLEIDPLWSNMRNDSRFQMIVAETNHYLETQRDRVSSILGDIPVEY